MTSMSIELQNRLRISGPIPNRQEITDTRRALDRARLMMDAEPVKLSALVWVLFREAMETHRRLPNGGRNRSTSWPTVVHTAQEMWEADLQRLIDVKMSKEEPPVVRLPISDPTAVDRMLVVLGWLRYVRGRKPERDRHVLMALAAGASAQRVRNRYMGYERSDRAVYMVKDRACRHIAVAIRPYVDFSHLI